MPTVWQTNDEIRMINIFADKQTDRVHLHTHRKKSGHLCIYYMPIEIELKNEV